MRFLLTERLRGELSGSGVVSCPAGGGTLLALLRRLHPEPLRMDSGPATYLGPPLLPAVLTRTTA
ncbi:hypothetical protein LZF96_15035 [Streptomyces sp. ST2-7A]|nr:hypothetical protein [Streptomyces sp. ST2-7A]